MTPSRRGAPTDTSLRLEGYMKVQRSVQQVDVHGANALIFLFHHVNTIRLTQENI